MADLRQWPVAPDSGDGSAPSPRRERIVGRMTIRRRGWIAVAASALCLLIAPAALAQQHGKPAARPAPRKHVAQGAPNAVPAAKQAAKPAEAPPPPSWVSRCTSDRRKSVPECAVEQRVVLTRTGQLLAAVTVRLPPNSGHPVMMIQLPVGLFLPAGVHVRIDERPPTQLALQTCDVQGCYAGTPISPDMLAGMKAGKRFNVAFQNLSKETITVGFDLANFAEAYGRIE